MTENYNPTRKEVFHEMYNNLKTKFSKENISKMEEPVSNFMKMYAKSAAITIFMPHVIPTFYRLIDDSINVLSYDKIDVKKVGTLCGLLTGSLVAMGQLIGYGYVVEKDHPEILLFPLATNVISGAYEIGKKIYNKTKEKMIQNNPEGIEKIIVEEEKSDLTQYSEEEGWPGRKRFHGRFLYQESTDSIQNSKEEGFPGRGRFHGRFFP